MQEIIIYRSPLEAAIWNSLSSPDGMTIFLAVMMLGVLWCVSYLVTQRIIVRFARYNYYKSHTPCMWVATLITLAVAILLHVRYIS